MILGGFSLQQLGAELTFPTTQHTPLPLGSPGSGLVSGQEPGLTPECLTPLRLPRWRTLLVLVSECDRLLAPLYGGPKMSFVLLLLLLLLWMPSPCLERRCDGWVRAKRLTLQVPGCWPSYMRNT